MHDFLIHRAEHRTSALRPSARKIPLIRDYIEELPPTSSFFSLSEIDGISEYHGLDPIHVELTGSWPAHYIWDPSTSAQRYVNPNGAHADCYSDLVVQCDCGTYVAYHRENNVRIIHDSAGHDEDCLPHWRLSARAELAEKRYEELNRLTRLGWKDPDFAPRFGLNPGRVSSLAADYGLSMRELYSRYQREAGETYLYLVRKHGISADLVADIYGHDKSTLGRWARKFDLDVPHPEIDERCRDAPAAAGAGD